MNRILVDIGNHKLLLPATDGAGVLLAALMACEAVESHGYGDEERFTPTGAADLSARAIAGERFISDAAEGLRVQLEQAKAESKQNESRWLTYYNKVNELEKKLAAANAPAPTP